MPQVIHTGYIKFQICRGDADIDLEIEFEHEGVDIMEMRAYLIQDEPDLNLKRGEQIELTWQEEWDAIDRIGKYYFCL